MRKNQTKYSYGRVRMDACFVRNFVYEIKIFRTFSMVIVCCFKRRLNKKKRTWVWRIHVNRIRLTRRQLEVYRWTSGTVKGKNIIIVLDGNSVFTNNPVRTPHRRSFWSHMHTGHSSLCSSCIGLSWFAYCPLTEQSCKPFFRLITTESSLKIRVVTCTEGLYPIIRSFKRESVCEKIN